jgi:hypothetical protein
MNCPLCQAADARFREKRNDWICDVCDYHWVADATSARTTSADQTPAISKVKLFLSYCRRDAKLLADRLCIDLSAAGYDVWQDTREISTGTDWQQEIVDGLRSAQVVVGLLSPHSVRMSTTSADGVASICLGELTYALFNPPSQPVIPVMAAPCEPPLCLFHLDYTDMTAWQQSEEKYQAGLQRLLAGIQAAMRGEKRFRGWYHQLRPWDFAPFLYEKRREFCGREWLFDELDAWRVAHAESTLLITGDPGTGKSALVAELVHRNPHGQVLAFHCCQADTPETLKPGRFVRSIAAMIASQLEGYSQRLSEPHLEEILGEEYSDKDPASAFEEGILVPLQSLGCCTWGSQPL